LGSAGKYRHEFKYNISMGEYLELKHRLMPVMKYDIHNVDGKIYKIRSIYFDNYSDKALREKVNGVQKREKFRIRYYDDNFDCIKLEKKIKHNNLTLKVNTRINYEELQNILSGNIEFMKDDSRELVKELYCKMKSQRLVPKVTVSYDREAYIYKAGNVRVTFDSNIRTSLFKSNFLDDNVYDIPATDLPTDMILEVKYDEFVPDIVLDILACNLRQTAFSKYGICRRFG